MIILFTTNSRSQDVPKIRIDPAKAFGGKVSEYFESVEYIPLETTKESLFGAAVYQLITDSSVVVYDFDTKSILFFTHEGKLIKKITDKTATVRLALDAELKCIMVTFLDMFSTKEDIKYYSLCGTYLGTPTLKKQKASSVVGKIAMGNGYIAVANNHYLMPSENPVDSVGYLIDIYKDGKLHKHMLPINQKSDPAFAALSGQIILPDFVQNGVFYIEKGLDYSLYRITKDTAIKTHQFVFPASRSISKDISGLKNIESLDSARVVIGSGTIITRVNNIFFLKNKLFFMIGVNHRVFSESTADNAIYNFIYDTITQSLVALERITPDTMCSYLPLFDFTVKLQGLKYSNGYFYTTISSLELFTAYEKNKFRNPQYPPVLQEYFKTQNRKSNPVIVKMKMKE